MAKQTVNDTQVINDEFTKIFDAYRARIDEITRRTQKNLNADSDVAVATAPEPSRSHPGPESPIALVTQRIVQKPHNTIVSPAPENEVDIAPVVSTPVITPDITPVSALPVDKADIALESPLPEDKPDIEYISSAPVYKANIMPFTAPKPQLKADIPPVVKLELPAIKESEAIIKEAKRQAQRIIAEAEETIKKEAKKKTQSSVDKIITSAQKEAEDIINKAAQSVDKERTEAVSMLKQESERLTREIKEKFAEENHQQSAQIIAEAREKAAAILKDVISNSTEIGRQMDEIINRAKKTVADFELKLQADTGTLIKTVSETQAKLLQVSMIPEKENTPKAESPVPVRARESTKNPAMSVHLSSDNPKEKNYGAGLFSGQVEMKSASASFDYQYLKNLKKYLIHIPNIKYVQESASEREVSVLFDVKEPLPLIDILNHIPIIDEVITEADDDICLIFKSAD
jgi:hypothetical protein